LVARAAELLLFSGLRRFMNSVRHILLCVVCLFSTLSFSTACSSERSNVPSGSPLAPGAAPVQPSGMFAHLSAGDGPRLQGTAADTCAAAPGAPANFAGRISTTTARMVILSWDAPAAGCAPTDYLLQAGSGPGQTNQGQARVGNVLSTLAVDVPLGTYYVRAFALNAAGMSPASNEILMTVPSTAAPTLTSVAPNSYYYGSTQTVTLTGTNFVPAAAAVSVSGGGVTASNITVASATTATLTL